MQLLVGAQVFFEGQVVDGVQGNDAIESIWPEGQVGNIGDDEQAVTAAGGIADALAGLLQGHAGDIQADAALVVGGPRVAQRILQVFGVLEGARAGIQQQAAARLEVAQHAQVAIVDVLARDRAQVFVGGVLVDARAELLPTDLVVEFAHLGFGGGGGVVGGGYHVIGSPAR